MPLRAYINDQEIISIDLSDDEWTNLKADIKSKKSVLTLPCCGQEGYLRVSSKGLKHFVHSKSASPCDCASESAEHLKAKVAIVEACRENGWEAIPEFSEKDWRADVLAVQGQKRIAFEVQWSKQSYEETQYRQKRYKESNVRGCWFLRTPPKEMTDYHKNIIADKDIPAFKICKNDDSDIIAQVGQRQMPLKTLVAGLLNRKLKFCRHIRLKPKQNVTIIFFKYKCWKCQRPQYCYTVYPKFFTICGLEHDMMDGMWNDDDIDKSPQIQAEVQQFLKSEKGKDIKVGSIKRRFSGTVEHSYLSHGCYYCDVIFGDFYLSPSKLDVYNDWHTQSGLENYVQHTAEIDVGRIIEEQPHWCFSEDRHFCE